jgi:hypothetical protein
MHNMEQFKLELMAAARSKRVRLGQDRDHLIWVRPQESEICGPDGTPEDHRVYVFWSFTDNRDLYYRGVVTLISQEYCRSFSSKQDFLDYVASVTWEVA